MRKLLTLPLLLLSVWSFAQSGIVFEHGTWEAAKQKAMSENKLIFADFYTAWCGPCLSMAENVFVLPEVGSFYNSNFVNTKVDAENGEGADLAAKYKIASYPTYLFIDPKTEEVVHRSSSRQDKDVFLFTGASALNPTMRSFYLEKAYTDAKCDDATVRNYMNYLSSVYRRDELQKVVDKYSARPAFSLMNADDWSVFLKHQSGTDNASFREVMANKAKYVAQYGQKSVDEKLYHEFNNSLNLELLASAPAFHGKEFLLQKNRAEKHLRDKEYDKVTVILSQLMAEPGEFKEQLCVYLKFVSRSMLYGEHTDEWCKACVQYAQYIAYNSYNREDPNIHYEYANILENVIRRMPDAGKYFPESVTIAPERDKSYSLRSPKLQKKPTTRKKK